MAVASSILADLFDFKTNYARHMSHIQYVKDIFKLDHYKKVEF